MNQVTFSIGDRATSLQVDNQSTIDSLSLQLSVLCLFLYLLIQNYFQLDFTKLYFRWNDCKLDSRQPLGQQVVFPCTIDICQKVSVGVEWNGEIKSVKVYTNAPYSMVLDIIIKKLGITQPKDRLCLYYNEKVRLSLDAVIPFEGCKDRLKVVYIENSEGLCFV